MSRAMQWYGKAAHFIGGNHCRFHMATKVGGYIVSTIGELWWERSSREIHAQISDPKWSADNRQRKGDDFDAAYFKRFGYETIGCDRKYETMVFVAGPPCKSEECNCGVPRISGSELDFGAYNTAGEATAGHMRLVKKWAKKADRDDDAEA